MKIYTKIALFEAYIKREKLKNDERFLREIAKLKLEAAIVESRNAGKITIILPKNVRKYLTAI